MNNTEGVFLLLDMHAKSTCIDQRHFEVKYIF